MDDARLERLLTKPQGPRPEKPKRQAGLSLGKVYDEDQNHGFLATDMLKTRPRPASPKRKPRELSEAGKPLPEHGTAARYKHHGCRCEKCKTSQAAYRARKKAERRAA